MKYLNTLFALLAFLVLIGVATGALQPNYWDSLIAAFLIFLLFTREAWDAWDDYFHVQDEIRED